MSEIIWIATRVLAFAALLVLLPMGAGYVFFHKGQLDRGLTFLFGVCAVLALFEVIYIPFFLLGLSFSLLTAVFFVAACAFALLGLVLRGNYASAHPAAPRAPLSRREGLLAIGVGLIILWQIARTTFGAGTWNIDDGWYIALTNTALYTDDIMRTDPLTGFPLDYVEHMAEYLSYVFSPWPLFWGCFCRLLSFAPTVLMRTMLPGFIIILFYYVMLRLAMFFFRDSRETALTALLLFAVFCEIAGVAMNLKYTWIICYPWMGKAFGPSIISPLALLFFLLIEDADAQRQKALWLCIFVANIAGCMAASSCAEMTLMFLGCWGLIYIIRTRDFSALWRLCAVSMPSVALMAAHFVM